MLRNTDVIETFAQVVLLKQYMKIKDSFSTSVAKGVKFQFASIGDALVVVAYCLKERRKRVSGVEMNVLVIETPSQLSKFTRLLPK